MRHWLLTNTTYGTWLPGDRRGCVTSVRDRRENDPVSEIRFEHDLPGEAYDDEMPGLQRAAAEQMNGPVIYLDREKSEIVLKQFLETAEFRGWEIFSASIMNNHFHMVVRVAGDPEPRKVLADFKAYGSRVLNKKYGVPASETWWTTNGSKRKLKDEKHIEAAIRYVLYKQYRPLAVWSADEVRYPTSGIVVG